MITNRFFFILIHKFNNTCNKFTKKQQQGKNPAKALTKSKVGKATSKGFNRSTRLVGVEGHL